MSSLSSRYQPLRTNDEEFADGARKSIDVLPSRPYEEDDDAALLGNQDAKNVKRSKYLSKYNICTCIHLSKRTICISALILLILVISTAGGGYWSYQLSFIQGQSPPWYPTPVGGTVSSWEKSYDLAKKMVERMSLVEKVNITTGTGWAMDLCVGNTGPATEVGFPSLCLQDGPLGIRFSDHATSFPAGITVGATWNRDLMRRRGSAHALQAKMKGIHVLLGPAMGPLGRNPAGGRIWEGFGADPVLQAVAAYETIEGIQSQGVMATAKHFVGNEQEHFRKSFEWGLPEALSSNIDDRVLHEIYAWPFAQSIRAGVASIMCSYQMVNNSYACENSKLMNGILKDELGFQGFIQSDWLAQRSGVASALSGLDMSMPGDGIHWIDGKPLFGNQLTLAVLNGSIPTSRLNDMATRIVAAWYQLGQDKWNNEGPNFSSWTDEQYGRLHDGSSSAQNQTIVNKFVETETDESRQVARQVAAEGTVLLKNDDGILPLDKHLTGLAGDGIKKIAVIGEDAGPGNGPNYCDDRACNQGTLAVGWGSGATEFTYLVDPLSAINNTLDSNSVQLTALLKNDLTSRDKSELNQQNLCLVFANADSGEGHRSWSGVRADRNDLELQKGGANLVRNVADSCGGPTLVILHSVGPVVLESFADLSQVKAILYANLPGQESGNALVDVLFGTVDASGRLPYTIGKSLKDYGPGAAVLYRPNAIIPQVDFKEGLFIDYRHFDKADIEPRYPFGYGLSYTTFEMSQIKITSLKPKSLLPDPRPAGLSPPTYKEEIPDSKSALFPTEFRKLKKYIYPYISSTSQVKKGAYPYPEGYNKVQIPSPAGGGEGGNPSLFDPHVEVQVRVSNVGPRTGKEVIQLYVTLPHNITESTTGDLVETPIRVLRNFTKIELQSGQTDIVRMQLTRKDLSYWSVVQQNWIMPEGNFLLSIGRHSRDLPLHGTY